MKWIFDLCGTLYEENTTFAFIDRTSVGTLVPKVYVRARKFPPIKLFNKALHVLGLDLPRLLASFSLRGLPREALQQAARQLLHQLTPRKASQCLLQDCLNRGEEVYIASAAFDFIVETVANHLGVYNFRSTTLKYDSTNRCAGYIKEDLLGKKHMLLPDWTTSPFILVTDNLDDGKLVELSQHAFIVTARKNIGFWESYNNTTIIDITD